MAVCERPDNDEDDVRQPLLANDNPAPSNDPWPRLQLSYVLLIFLIGMFDMMIRVPAAILLEQSICRAYYDGYDAPAPVASNGSLGGDACRIGPVQQESATLRDWKVILDFVPG